MFRKSREDHDQQIDVLHSSHQKELRQVLANQALEQSTSKLTELQSKVDAQEVWNLYNTLKIIKYQRVDIYITCI